MLRFLGTTLTMTALTIFAVSASSQAPGDKDQPPKKKKKDGFDGGPPKKFEVGKVLPPHIREELELTPEQETALAALEKDVKSRLEKILTADQLQMIERMRPKGPPDGKGPKKDKKKDDDDKEF